MYKRDYYLGFYLHTKHYPYQQIKVSRRDFYEAIERISKDYNVSSRTTLDGEVFYYYTFDGNIFNIGYYVNL